MKPYRCDWRGVAEEEQKVLRAQGAEVNHVGGVMTSAEPGALHSFTDVALLAPPGKHKAEEPKKNHKDSHQPGCSPLKAAQ